MSKGNTFENDVVKLVFNATALSWNANTDLYMSLHTADPGEAGSQTTSESAVGAYARQAVLRTVGGWTVSGNQAVNAATISFPECTSGSETITHFAIGTSLSGAGQVLYKGALGASRVISAGYTLQFAAGTIAVSED